MVKKEVSAKKRDAQVKVEPFTLLEGPQGFRQLSYTVSLAAEESNVELRILAPLLVQVERNGESLGLVNLGTLRLDEYRRLVADRLRKIKTETMGYPSLLMVPLNQSFTVKGETFNLMLKVEKER